MAEEKKAEEKKRTKKEEEQLVIPDVLPLLPVRDVVIFPS